MTIINDWCPSCYESCHDHASICTVCGDPLQSRPASRTRPVAAEPSVRVSALPDTASLMRDLATSNNEIAIMLGGLRERVSGIRQQVTEIRQRMGEAQQNVVAQQQQQLPPEAMDPQQGASRSRPTAQQTLVSMPRIILQPTMSMMLQATVLVGKKSYEAVCGDFGSAPPIALHDKGLVLAEPRTGRGEKISDATKIGVQGGAILYMERGDGVTFVRKAMLAQDAGASAVVIGNNTSVSWPYIMKDSVGEATKLGLRIPVVMLKQSDGQALAKSCQDCTQTCTLKINKAAKECIICVENMGVGHTVVQLPSCGHVFHETCAMTWLKHHNSCPYCRRELPTDDEEYDAERRRTQRTHAGSSAGASTSTESNGVAFYG
jgi:hypothetical protein